MKGAPTFRIKRHETIGAADAESDAEYLIDCFVDTGTLAVIRDCSKPNRLIVGRTGIGKSALLNELRASEDHVIELAPEVLSLSYLTNSNILQFFDNLGVQLDPFYRLLWHHIFTVELIREKFKINDERKKSEFLKWLNALFERNKNKKKAIDYLEEWGSRFWEETEYRIKEFTTKLESDLEAAVKVETFGLTGTIGAADKWSEEQRQEVVQRAQNVVSGVQIKDLHDVIKLLSEDVFDDRKERFFIVIDRLDENWVDDKIRYKLLRALLEAVRTFQQIQCVKIVVALRTDLLDRVFKKTRDAGFQEEKYESLTLRLRWSKEQIEEVLDRRVNKLIRRQYTNSEVGVRDILPDDKKDQPALDYIIDRTFLRPREAIMYINECLAAAEGKAQITWQTLQSTEVEYSRKRLRSLADEWHSDFPCLPSYTRILNKRKSSFLYSSVPAADIEKFVERLFEDGLNDADPICRAAEQYLNSKLSLEHVSDEVFRALYQVGVVGVKLDATSTTQWSYANQPSLTQAQLSPSVRMEVHPTFWNVLGIVRNGGR